LRKKYSILFFLFQFIFAVSQTPEIGIPFIRNYKPETYGADNQNWSAVQDNQGILYFANNNGVLRFNGSSWQIVGAAGNLSTIRSLAIDSKGTIYAGGYAEFGYLDENRNGQIFYHSMIGKIPPQYRKFNDVWQIFPTRRGIVFHSTYFSYYYINDTIEVIKHPNESSRSFNVFDRVLIQFKDRLRELIDGKLIDIPLGEQFSRFAVAFMIPFQQNTILVGTESDGLMIYDYKTLISFPTEADEFMKKNKLYSGIPLNDGSIALGTLHGGLMIIDKTGKSLLHLNTENGLQNNTIISIKTDNTGDLWVIMDQGIDCIEIGSPISKLYNSQLEGNVYAVNLFHDKLYIATHHGLFWQTFDALKNPNIISNLKPVAGVKEINWNLTTIDNFLFLGHDDGTYLIENNTAKRISQVKGGWCYRKLALYGNCVIGGTYTGLIIFKNDGKEYRQYKLLKSLNESCRIIEDDNQGNIWITSGYNGVYRLRLNENADSITTLKFYDNHCGFPEGVFYGIHKVNGEIIFGTQQGAYAYNYAKDQMEPHKVFYSFFKGIHLRKLTEDKHGNIWFIAGNKTGILKLNSEGNYTMVKVPFLKITDDHVPGFENISFVDNNNVMIGTKHGILVYNPSLKRDYFTSYPTIIDKVSITAEHDSLIYSTGLDSSRDEPAPTAQITVPYRFNDLHFVFSAVYFENHENIQYRCMLEGFDEDWSSWNSKNEKEYTNIPEGNYFFRVKAKNIFDFESKEAVIKVTVLAPWYRSKWAYGVYILLAFLSLMAFIKIKNRQFEKARKKLEEENQNILRLKAAEHAQEKLEEELKNKNKELAAATMNVAQKNEVFIKIKDKLTQVYEYVGEKERNKLNSLIRLLDDEMNDETYWEQFEIHFNMLNDNFLKRLQQQHPSLTSKDLKMCAFLRMNLSNKEIASLLNITLRGVEASRLRIRRKIDMPKDAPLTEYILKF
jgi:ligand-binding sensor domain-containing protein/DNA-binding CsgD family transcriptional regulator